MSRLPPIAGSAPTSPENNANAKPSLANFGIVLTGRLGLRNDLLSTFSMGKEVWDERYFVLTRKGLHYYVRQRDSGDANRRDLFGEHEGSIALGNIAKVDVCEHSEHDMVFAIVCKNGARKYVLRADSSELYHRWLVTLQAAADPSSPGSFYASGRSGSLNGSGGHVARISSMRSSSSFPRIPTLLDFRAPPKTDNIANVVIFSSTLGLDLLLEVGLPWGVQTTIETKLHRLSAALTTGNAPSSADVLRITLEGGATCTIPLARTLMRRGTGSALVTLQAPTSEHKAIKFSWAAIPLTAPSHIEAADTRTPHASSSMLLFTQLFTVLATLAAAAAAVFAASAADPAQNRTRTTASSTPPPPPAAATGRSAGHHHASNQHHHATAAGGGDAASSASASSTGSWSGALVHLLFTPLGWDLHSLVRVALLALCARHLGRRLRGTHNRGTSSVGAGGASRTSLARRLLPAFVLPRLPLSFSRAIATSELPEAWCVSFEPNKGEAATEEGAAGGKLSRNNSGAGSPHTLRRGDPGRRTPPDSELQVDALFADVASIEHTLLYDAAVALRAAFDASSRAVPASKASTGPSPQAAPSKPPSPPTAKGGDGAGAGVGVGGVGVSRSDTSASDAPTESAEVQGHAQAQAGGEGGEDTSPLMAPSPGAGGGDHSVGDGGGEGAAAAAPEAAPLDLQLETLLKAFELAVVQVLMSLGPAMLIVVKNDQANIRKVREAAERAAKEGHGPEAQHQSLRGLFQHEVQRGIHKPGAIVQPRNSVSAAAAGSGNGSGSLPGTPQPPRRGSLPPIGSTGGAILQDPSAAMAVLWLKRSLKLTIILMEQLLLAKERLDDEERLASLQVLDMDDDEPPSPSAASGSVGAECLKYAYENSMKQFHGWLLAKIFATVASQAPTLEEAVALIGAGLGVAERETKVFQEVRLFVQEGRPIVEMLDELYADLELEDLRQV